MGSKYDKIRKEISENPGPLPPALDWEQMEDGILKKMEELQSAKSSSKRKRRAIIILLIFLFITSALSIYVISKTDSSEKPKMATDQAIKVHDEVSKQSFEQANTNSQHSASIENQEHKPLIIDNVQLEGTKSKSTLESVNPLKSYENSRFLQQDLFDHTNTQKATLGFSKEAKFLEQLSGVDTFLANRVEPIFLKKKPQYLVESLSNSTYKDILESIALNGKNETYSDYSMPFLPTTTPFIDNEPEKIAWPLLAEKEIDRKQSARPALRMTLLSGISFWNMGYGATKPVRDQYEQPITSFNVQFNSIRTIKKNYTLLVGFQFQQLESRFDWNTRLDDYKITLTDTIIQIQTNALTGQQSEIRGDIELSVSARRMVRHYNKIRLYQIPFAAGKTWTHKMWQADLLIGGTLNFFSKNKGRTFYQGELQYFNGPSTDFMENRLKIHGLIMGRLTYHINGNFGIITGVQFQRSLTNWDKEGGIRMHPNIFNWEFGINFSLN